MQNIPADWWPNDFLPALDAATLYHYVTARKPTNYLEIGSGVSTKFARRAIQDSNLHSLITSIDPAPRVDIDKFCDKIIRQPVENTSLNVFAALQSGDILFVDNSHQSFQNSDVTVFFLDILPNLSPGILVGIHDITLPDDYPPSYAHNYYNEQYLLAAWLLGGSQGIEITLPNWYASKTQELSQIIAPIFSQSQFNQVDTHGSIFWFTISPLTK